MELIRYIIEKLGKKGLFAFFVLISVLFVATIITTGKCQPIKIFDTTILQKQCSYVNIAIQHEIENTNLTDRKESIIVTLNGDSKSSNLSDASGNIVNTITFNVLENEYPINYIISGTYKGSDRVIAIKGIGTIVPDRDKIYRISTNEAPQGSGWEYLLREEQ